jgi:hypothetical protein
MWSSSIDATKPTRKRAETADVRAQFAETKLEIEALQRGVGTVELYGGGPTKTGAQNRVAAQAAIDAGGRVWATTPGTWDIDAGLTIGSNTRFEWAEGVRWKKALGTGTNFAFLKNKNFGSVAQKVATIQSGATIGDYGLRLVTVTFSTYDPLAGLWPVGGYVYVQGDTSECYNGMFQIETVTSNSVAFFIAQGQGSGAMPDATGSAIRASLCDANIWVGGGVIDANARAGFTRSSTYEDHQICFDKVMNPVVERVTFYDGYKYCVMLQNCVRPKVRHMYAETRSDGVKVYGPCWDPVIEDVSGDYGDDVVSFQTMEPDGYVGFMAPDNVGTGLSSQRGGTFWQGGTVRRIVANASHVSHVAFYPSGGSTSAPLGYLMKGEYVVEHVTSQISPEWGSGNPTPGPQAVMSVGAGYVPQPGTIDRLTIRGLQGQLLCDNSGTGQTITIHHLKIESLGSSIDKQTYFSMSMDYCDMKMIEVLGGHWVGGWGGSQLFQLRSANAIIRNLVAIGTYFGATSSSLEVLRTLSNTGTLECATFVACVFGPATAVVNGVKWSNTPDIYFNGCRWESGYGSSITVTGSGNYNLHYSNCRAAGPINGFFNFYGPYTGTVNIWIQGTTVSGTLFANQTGTINWYNPDGSVPIDITKIARAHGSIAKHNGGTTAGTIPTNCIAVCDATNTTNSWSCISAGAIKTY